MDHIIIWKLDEVICMLYQRNTRELISFLQRQEEVGYQKVLLLLNLMKCVFQSGGLSQKLDNLENQRDATIKRDNDMR